MANLLYPKAKEAFLGGSIDLSTDTIRVTLLDLDDYTYDEALDIINDVAAGARVATATLSGKSLTNGTFDASDVTFSSVTGDQSEALILWKDTGVESTSPLIAYIDTGVTGFPVTPSGGDIPLVWDAQGIFAL